MQQNLNYILSVENTGELPLENIEISSVFSQDNIKAEWKQEEGLLQMVCRELFQVLRQEKSESSDDSTAYRRAGRRAYSYSNCKSEISGKGRKYWMLEISRNRSHCIKGGF